MKGTLTGKRRCTDHTHGSRRIYRCRNRRPVMLLRRADKGLAILLSKVATHRTQRGEGRIDNTDNFWYYA